LGDLLSDAFRRRILDEITPTDNEVALQKSTIALLIEALKLYAEQEELQYTRIQAEGSTGKKQTQLRGASDLDIFVVLNPLHYEKVICEDAKGQSLAVDSVMDNLVESWFKPAIYSLKPSSMKKTYSQHPYLSVKYQEFDVDIVGCFELSAQELSSSGPISAMDRTIHHSEYVALHLDHDKRNDVRMLKSFARASHAYGDTCAVGQMGFTGYALELLIIQNNSFGEALETIIDLETTPLDPIRREITELEEIPAFKDNHVFIIDPTDPGRNVASSFDKRSYRLLKLLSSELLAASRDGNEEQMRSLLLEKPISSSEPPSWFMSNSLTYEFKSDGSTHYTVLRDKLYRLGRQVVSHLQREATGEKRFGDAIFEVYFERERFCLGFLIEQMTIAESFASRGPPINLDMAVEEFQKTHSVTYERDGYIWAIRNRPQTSAEVVVNDFIESNTIKGLERVQNSATSQRLANIIHNYVLLAEPTFPTQRIKEPLTSKSKE